MNGFAWMCANLLQLNMSQTEVIGAPRRHADKRRLQLLPTAEIRLYRGLRNVSTVLILGSLRIDSMYVSGFKYHITPSKCVRNFDIDSDVTINCEDLCDAGGK